MNAALWPATFGYFMESMMYPLFAAPGIVRTKAFFTQLVSGRGSRPALRIGRQPYGIVPATVLSRMKWPAAGTDTTPTNAFSGLLYGVLSRMQTRWNTMANQAAHLGAGGGGGDPHQALLDVIGLHPSSVEFHQRYAEGLDLLFNLANLDGSGRALLLHLSQAQYADKAMTLLQRLANTHLEGPELVQLFFHNEQQHLRGPVVDDRPLSETDPIRAYTANGLNYIAWLINASRTSFDTVRLSSGFLDSKPPTALL